MWSIRLLRVVLYCSEVFPCIFMVYDNTACTINGRAAHIHAQYTGRYNIYLVWLTTSYHLHCSLFRDDANYLLISSNSERVAPLCLNTPSSTCVLRSGDWWCRSHVTLLPRTCYSFRACVLVCVVRPSGRLGAFVSHLHVMKEEEGVARACIHTHYIV